MVLSYLRIICFSGRTKIRETRNCSCYIKHLHFIVRHLGTSFLLLFTLELWSFVCNLCSRELTCQTQKLRRTLYLYFLFEGTTCPFWAPKLILIMYGWSLVLHHSISYAGFFYNFSFLCYVSLFFYGFMSSVNFPQWYCDCCLLFQFH